MPCAYGLDVGEPRGAVDGEPGPAYDEFRELIRASLSTRDADWAKTETRAAGEEHYEVRHHRRRDVFNHTPHDVTYKCEEIRGLVRGGSTSSCQIWEDRVKHARWFEEFGAREEFAHIQRWEVTCGTNSDFKHPDTWAACLLYIYHIISYHSLYIKIFMNTLIVSTKTALWEEAPGCRTVMRSSSASFLWKRSGSTSTCYTYCCCTVYTVLYCSVVGAIKLLVGAHVPMSSRWSVCSAGLQNHPAATASVLGASIRRPAARSIEAVNGTRTRRLVALLLPAASHGTRPEFTCVVTSPSLTTTAFSSLSLGPRSNLEV